MSETNAVTPGDESVILPPELIGTNDQMVFATKQLARAAAQIDTAFYAAEQALQLGLNIGLLQRILAEKTDEEAAALEEMFTQMNLRSRFVADFMGLFISLKETIEESRAVVQRMRVEVR